MESLNAHYRLLLGLNDDWAVDDVDLSVPDKRVSIALSFVSDRVTSTTRFRVWAAFFMRGQTPGTGTLPTFDN